MSADERQENANTVASVAEKLGVSVDDVELSLDLVRGLAVHGETVIDVWRGAATQLDTTFGCCRHRGLAAMSDAALEIRDIVMNEALSATTDIAREMRVANIEVCLREFIDGVSVPRQCTRLLEEWRQSECSHEP